ncbi:MAG TPA: hypothetical protein VKA26_12060 [Ignavibacteriaceae bacterium]|nr:hypothetical protein [Ignavibacteriaceae bacterium]
MKKISFAAALLFLLSATACPQAVVDSLQFLKSEPIKNLLLTNFDKQLNTYILNTTLKYNNSFGRFVLNLEENYNSSFIRSAIKSVRDEHSLRFSSAYRINNKFSLGVLANNNIFSDSRHIEINQASQTSAALFTQYSPEENIKISPFFGFINNEQTGEQDYGYLYGAEGSLENIHFSESNLLSQIKFRNEDISPRKNSIRYMNFILTNFFNENSGNIINASYSQNRKDFYFPADSITSLDFNISNNIQSRIETNYFLQDRFLTKDFLDMFDLDITGSFLWRTIDRETRYKSLIVNSSSLFDTKINELRIDFDSFTTYNSDIFNGSLRLTYSERDEKHITKNYEGTDQIAFQEKQDQESRKNNQTLRISAAFTGEFFLSKSDKISLSLYQNKLRYDTPSSLNFDDRDEMLSIIRLQYSKLLTPFFELYVNTDATISQTVYIFSEKSSNNNVNRILRLKAGGNYRGKYVTSLNSFEVSANYTVYDYEDINPNYKSFSFRQFTARDSTSLKLNRRLIFSTYGYLKLSEQGDLKWASFSTHPTRYLQEIYSESKLTVFYNLVRFSIGARIFSLNSYNYKITEKIIDSKFLSIAPLTEVIISENDSLYFRLYGWYEFINLSGSENKEEANLSIQMNWNF